MMSNLSETSPRQSNVPLGTPTHVSEPAFEFLLSEMLHWVEIDCYKDEQKGVITIDPPVNQNMQPEEEEAMREEEKIMAAERAAAKMERIGFDVGYRLVERLAQSKSLVPTGGGTKNANSPPTPAMIQLEAVKFLCKEFWSEVFRKQIDKLQTNHRGVFVLRDHEFKWLKRLPNDDEASRVAAIKLLAFPCGLIRGALDNLNIIAVVSCDFLADGKSMASCSFNIKVKS